MNIKGMIFTKKEFEKSTVLVGDSEKYKGQLLRVVDIAVDGSGYLCVANDGSGLGMIEKEDTMSEFIPIDLFKTWE